MAPALEATPITTPIPPRHYWWLAANIVGVVAFMASASRFWIEPELADVPGASIGNAISWTYEAAPIAVVFLLTNLIWLARSLLRPAYRGEWITISLAILLIAVWIAAWLIDNAHHGM